MYDLVTSVLANCITTMICNTTSLILTILTATVIAVHVRNVRTNRFRRKRSGFEHRHFTKYGLSSKLNQINVSVLHRKVLNIMKYFYPEFVTDLKFGNFFRSKRAISTSPRITDLWLVLLLLFL